MLTLLAGAAAQAQDAAQTPDSPPLQLQATPMLAEKPPVNSDPPSFIYGERISGRPDLETVLEGEAELRRPGLTARSDKITHDQTTGIATLDGHVQVNQQGNRFTGTTGQLQVDAFTGFLLQPTYHFLATGGHGNAERIDFIDQDQSTLIEGNYTTCPRPPDADPNWRPSWILRADRIDIDRENNEGNAENAVLEFKGMPLLPLPALSFPLNEERKSGWLPPTIGLDNKSGLDLAVPYYWNIAPQRDATFTPEVMLRRGFNMMGEFRYMESNYKGSIDANYMPDDKLRGRNRWSLFARHNGTYDTGLPGIGPFNIALNLNRVSDDNYWSDFSHDGMQTTRLLVNDAGISWAHDDFSFSARAQKWQTLQDVTAPIVPPYDRLPEVSGRWARVNDRGFDYSVDMDYTRFRRDLASYISTGASTSSDPTLTQPDGERELLKAQLSRPFTRPWGFLTPKVLLHATSYQFDQALSNGATTASRLIPTFSLDTGLEFERDASYFGRAFRQTLEPRLMYVYTPYRDQSILPNYDSGVYDFNFATIWSENFFAGDDRVVDNNLITGGLTTRLLDPTSGSEILRLGIAQRYRFSGQKVVLPGGTPTNPGWSDVMLGATVNWSPRWSFDTVVQYNPDTHLSTRTTVDARWSPGAFRTFSVAYLHQRDLNNEAIDIGWQWPLFGAAKRKELGATSHAGGSCGSSGALYSVGRVNFSITDHKVVDGVLGFEYDAGCWIGRVVVEQLQQSTTTAATRRILFQLEFVGLSRVGSNLMHTLRQNIPRYQNLREDNPPAPSRFTAYD